MLMKERGGGSAFLCRVVKRMTFLLGMYEQRRRAGIHGGGSGIDLLTIGLVALAFAGFVACERTPEQAPEAKKAVVDDRPGVLRLTSEELARTAIEVIPVARGQLRVPREFPATVQSNENELPTVLVRCAQGRTVRLLPLKEKRASLDGSLGEVMLARR
jgi:hypothetical protein